MYLKSQLHNIGYFILIIIAIEVIIIGGIIVHTKIISSAPSYLEKENRLFEALPFSDLCIATESRHTRHISQPEPIAPFQDMPGFYDHFPSSTFLPPPPYYKTILK